MTLQRHRSLMQRKAAPAQLQSLNLKSGRLQRQGSLPAKFRGNSQAVDIRRMHMGYDVGPPAGMLRSGLSSRRELVEQLDSEPLFDYLVQNGALEGHMVDQIRAEKSAAKVNLALLRHLESSGQVALSLLINALRQTGQHHLASLLDDSGRIKALSGSGYLSQKRHRGQVSLCIEVKALRLPQETKYAEDAEKNEKRAAQMSSFREWVSLDDLLHRITELSNPIPTFHPSFQQMDISDAKGDQASKKDKSCICYCFSRLFSRRKGSGEKGNKDQSKPPGQGPSIASVSTSQVEVSINQNGFQKNNFDALETKLNNQDIAKSLSSSSSNRDTLENLKNLVETFREKSQKLYAILQECSSTAYSQLLKYFEQDRGVLVLDTNCNDGLVIVNICMKMEQLEQMRRDYNNGKLTKDLENCIVTNELLSQIGAKGIKLKADIDQEEFEQAEQELS